ncbi:MAG: protein tyrosine phosphatase [Dermabacteraceae bacterium]|uniref:arsenate reductase/protein-tyrosine-phosphatase family protein n=1 Tax=Brachybacterium sp. TaxID=1891286 RepID=UPI00265467DC|nr:protein tyrosine phosphatase [Brachybacterium sp.]MDN6328687.1 protein tyrosine phosphatase [Brachybacterium sp.]
MDPLRLLTVCTGNVCRSPAAAVMLRAAVEEAGLVGSIEVGSAGTSWEAEGMPMDDRTELALERAGYSRPFEHVARTLHLTEMLAWDLVLPMTADHAQRMRRMAEQAPEGTSPPEIRMWRRFEPGITPDMPATEIAVEDPWYEGQGAFDRTILQLRLSVPGIIARAQEMLTER